MAHDYSETRSNPTTQTNNAHLLGFPKEMWTLDDHLSAFTESSLYCDHCKVKYTPTVQLTPPPEAVSSGHPFTTVFRVFPSKGPPSGGTVVTLTGRGFIESLNLLCRFQGAVSRQGGQNQGIGLVKANFLSSNQISCKSPAHTYIGNVSVSVTNDGEFFNQDYVMFEYSTVIPVLHGISIEPGPMKGYPATFCPIRTPVTGGTVVTIHGENFLQSDATQQLLFRMGEMPALPIHKFIDEKMVLIKTPPLHTRFRGDRDYSHDPTTEDHEPFYHRNFPESYTYPSPYPLRELRSNNDEPGSFYHEHGSAANDYSLDAAYPSWGQGKPFDCSRDAPGSICYRPAFTVRVSNDGGRRWSGFPPYSTQRSLSGVLTNRTNCILYADLVVSPDGDDNVGDGTSTRPFRTLYKAAQWAHGDGDRILMMRGTYGSSMLQQLHLQPKKLVVYQDVPLRNDQGGSLGEPLSKLCKCNDEPDSSVKLCECKHSLGLPFLQGENTFQQTQHDDVNDMTRRQRLGAGFANMQVPNGPIDGLSGESTVHISAGLAHHDYMGVIDSSFDDT